MAGDTWRSREAELIAKYAERLVPIDEGDDQGGEKKPAIASPKSSSKSKDDELELSYMNGAPPRDLLNYKNMDLEMSLWAKTGTGWMSLGVMILFAFACFILAIVLWLLRVGA
ncbi:MAG TPA: hypothetical protein VLQ48_01720 [Chloroflexia bacterium]|nr:hypothetical protein [Chloroflexia bacterium]